MTQLGNPIGPATGSALGSAGRAALLMVSLWAVGWSVYAHASKGSDRPEARPETAPDANRPRRQRGVIETQVFERPRGGAAILHWPQRATPVLMTGERFGSIATTPSLELWIAPPPVPPGWSSP